jgi:hypothetical protein
MINKRLLSLVAVATLVLGLTSVALAGIPDATNSTAASASGCIDITPAGNGPSLGNEGLTISVHVADLANTAIPGYPFQDIWWDDIGNGDLSMCQGGSVADANTNGTGDTTISGAAAGGGQTQAGVQVYLAGVPLNGAALLIDVNSPDETGDLVVNLSDIQEFSIDFNNPPYDFRSDFTCDGVENLSDVSALAIHNSESCP